MIRLILLLTGIFLFLSSCNNDRVNHASDISRLGDLEMDDIFLDYRITAEEGDDKLNIVLQFREGSELGRTLVVGDEGTVTLDGEELPVDSSGLTGAFYEIQKPMAAFSGEHTIRLTGPGGKKFEETFHFSPMTITNGIPDSISRSEDLVLDLGGLEKEEFVRVVMTDTSFSSEGINRLDTVYDGRLLLRQSDLNQLNKGDIHLELYREIDRPTRGGGEAGGRFTFTYVLKRDFILRD